MPIEFSRRQQGYLLVDHSASPGLTEDQARRAGYDPFYCKEGRKYETKTMRCCHCAGCVIPNPARTRERSSCPKCNYQYLCDGCAYEASLPDYIHAPALAKFEWRPRTFA